MILKEPLLPLPSEHLRLSRLIRRHRRKHEVSSSSLTFFMVLFSFRPPLLHPNCNVRIIVKNTIETKIVVLTRFLDQISIQI